MRSCFGMHTGRESKRTEQVCLPSFLLTHADYCYYYAINTDKITCVAATAFESAEVLNVRELEFALSNN